MSDQLPSNMNGKAGFALHNSTNETIQFWVTVGANITVGQTISVSDEIGMITINPGNWQMIECSAGAWRDLTVTNTSEKALCILKAQYTTEPSIYFWNGEVIHG